MDALQANHDAYARLILAEEPIHSAASTLTDSLARAEPKPQDQVAYAA
jgi:hypothetical protein